VDKDTLPRTRFGRGHCRERKFVEHLPTKPEGRTKKKKKKERERVTLSHHPQGLDKDKIGSEYVSQLWELSGKKRSKHP
jgi:hypothetical protein